MLWVKDGNRGSERAQAAAKSESETRVNAPSVPLHVFKPALFKVLPKALRTLILRCIVPQPDEGRTGDVDVLHVIKVERGCEGVWPVLRQRHVDSGSGENALRLKVSAGTRFRRAIHCPAVGGLAPVPTTLVVALVPTRLARHLGWRITAAFRLRRACGRHVRGSSATARGRIR